MNYFVIIKISLTNFVFELIIQKNFLLPNEFSEANLNAYKIILNWRPFMKRVSRTFQKLPIFQTPSLGSFRICPLSTLIRRENEACRKHSSNSVCWLSQIN